MAAKRGSFISLSSLDQSVENGQNLSEEGHGKPSARTRVKAAALSLLRLDRNSTRKYCNFLVFVVSLFWP